MDASETPARTAVVPIKLGWPFWLLTILIVVCTKLFGMLGAIAVYGLWVTTSYLIQRRKSATNPSQAILTQLPIVSWLAVLALILIVSGAFWISKPESNIVELPKADVKELILNANIEDGYIVGSFFNTNSKTTISEIAVEIIPTDSNDPFAKYDPITPRLVAVKAIAAPNSMSQSFKVQAGPINPEIHTLRIKSAKAAETSPDES